jgi:hypothetical protein
MLSFESSIHCFVIGAVTSRGFHLGKVLAAGGSLTQKRNRTSQSRYSGSRLTRELHAQECRVITAEAEAERRDV